MSMNVIKAKHILVGDTLEQLDNAALLIHDKKIEKIYRNCADVQFPPDAKVIDFGDKTVMPGMIDCHNHLALDARLENHLVKMNDCEAEQTIRAIKTMRDDLAAGVTSARCMGDRFYIDVVCREAQRAGRLAGPKLVVSGIGMRSLHGHGYVGMPHCGAEEFRKTARENIARGVDFLKVFMTKVINTTPFIYHFMTMEELRTVVEEAKSVNITTACHCSGGQGLDDCLTAGIDCLEHVYYISPEQVDRVGELDRWVVYTPSYFIDDTLLFKFSPQSREGSLAEQRMIRGCIENAIRSGLKFGIGTDGIHAGLAQEAMHIASLGADNRSVISGITVNAARLSGLENVTGMIKEGYMADLIALDGNPLEKIESLKQVRAVIQDGVLVSGSVF